MAESDSATNASDSDNITASPHGDSQEELGTPGMADGEIQRGIPTGEGGFGLPTGWYLPGIMDPDDRIQLDGDVPLPRGSAPKLLAGLRQAFDKIDGRVPSDSADAPASTPEQQLLQAQTAALTEMASEIRTSNAALMEVLAELKASRSSREGEQTAGT